MKIKIFLASLLLLSASSSFAKYGLVQDADGYVNVRAQASLKANVVAKLKNDEVVYCSDSSEKAFCHVSSSRLKEGGYIHLSRLDFFKNFTQWNAETTQGKTAIYRANKNQVSIAVRPAQFNTADFKSSRSNHDTHLFDLYKNKAFFGTDGDLPNQKSMFQLAEIKINFNGEQIVIPQSQLENYFFPNTPLGHNSKNDHEMATIYSKDDQLYILLDLNIGGVAHYHVNIHVDQNKLRSIQAWRS